MEPPAPTVLKPGPLKRVILAIVSAAILAGSVLLVRIHGHLWLRMIGWVAVFTFAFSTAFLIASLVLKRDRLLLTDEGFACQALLRSWWRGWKDVKRFTVCRIPPFVGLPFVVFDHVETYLARSGTNYLAKRIIRHEAALPDTYGLGAQELADLLNEWRRRAVGPAPEPPDTEPSDREPAPR